jgi:glycosyltransferase involved in cell wall biosynthesis
LRILVISNLFPPHYHGGYEIRCRQVATALARRGHTVEVVTSVYGLPEGTRPEAGVEQWEGIRVRRMLQQFAYPGRRIRRPWTYYQARAEIADTRAFVRVVRELRPDVVSWWSLDGITQTLLPLPRLLGVPDVHWIEDPWMLRNYGAQGEIPAAFWQVIWDGVWGPRPVRPLLRVLGRWAERRIAREGLPTRHFPNEPRHVCFVSEYLRSYYAAWGLTFASSEVIHGGVPVEEFLQPVRTPQPEQPLRLLYAGQISPDRGLHCVVEALGALDPSHRARVSLQVAGRGPVAYVESTRKRLDELRLSGQVTFLGQVSHSRMRTVYEGTDLLVFASSRPEGLPLTMVEAMLGGCAVVSTASGGAGEVAALCGHPTFPPEDPPALSRLLSQLIDDRDQLHELAARGQQVAVKEFSLERMLERWVATLQRVVEQGAKR